MTKKNLKKIIVLVIIITLIAVFKIGSSCLSVGELISLNQYSMASNKDKRAFKGVKKTV